MNRVLLWGEEAFLEFDGVSIAALAVGLAFAGRALFGELGTDGVGLQLAGRERIAL